MLLGKPENKENNTPALARKIRSKLYRDKHIRGVGVTGDPSGLQRSTTNEDGMNNDTFIADTFGGGILRPKIKLLKEQPPQVTRCEFVNEVFAGYNDYQVEIDITYRKLIEDLIYQLKNEDASKSKQKTTGPRRALNKRNTVTCQIASITCGATTFAIAGISRKAEKRQDMSSRQQQLLKGSTIKKYVQKIPQQQRLSGCNYSRRTGTAHTE